MSGQYGVETIRTDDGLVLITCGELDAANADGWFTAMAEAVENHCGTTSISSVIVDLCRVSFLSCAGVRAVLRLAERGARGDVAVRITVPDDGPVPRIVDVLAVRQNLPVCPGRTSPSRPASAAHPGPCGRTTRSGGPKVVREAMRSPRARGSSTALLRWRAAAAATWSRDEPRRERTSTPSAVHYTNKPASHRLTSSSGGTRRSSHRSPCRERGDRR
ncbi:STAS domain-containing protein [Nocardia gipuzkoensis]